MQVKDLREQNHHLRNELMDVEHSNSVLREENNDLRLRNEMLWRLARDLRDCIEAMQIEMLQEQSQDDSSQ